MLRRADLAAILAGLLLGLGACQMLPTVVDQPGVQCGSFAGPDCNDLLELGLDAVAGARPEAPAAIAVDGACPPNARCMASVLGGDTAAVIVRWADGTLSWATIPLPPDWPAHAPGPATAMQEPPPAHIVELVGG